MEHLGKTIPKSQHTLPSVTTEAGLLILVAEHGEPLEFARIATLQAALRGLPADTPKQTVRDVFHIGWRYAWLWESDAEQTELDRLIARRRDRF